MPSKPPSRCTDRQCRRLHDGTGKCPSCRAAADTRPPASQRGYDKTHEAEFAAAVLARDVMCQCDQPGKHGHGQLCHRLAEHADHYPLSRRQLVAMGANPNDPNHGRGLCAPCHSSETARLQPGGFNQRR